MKVKDLSLLIISENQTMRQLLAALVSDRYGSVTAAPPEQAASLMASNSFDLVLGPMLESDDAEDLKQTSDARAPTELRSGVTGKRYEFRSVNPKGSSCAAHPFERVLLEVAIERAEMSVNQVKRIVERDAIF